jgi:hypothetical protein
LLDWAPYINKNLNDITFNEAGISEKEAENSQNVLRDNKQKANGKPLKINPKNIELSLISCTAFQKQLDIVLLVITLINLFQYHCIREFLNVWLKCKEKME